MSDRNNEVEFIEKMRHTSSHVLAQAVLKFYPDTKLGIGPAIDNGFYYDFEFSQPITEEDLPKIEEEMKEIIKRDLPLNQTFKTRKETEEYFAKWGQNYKTELFNEIPDKEMSFFVTGDGEFSDMCRGPHIESTGKIGAIKLVRISGAYWRGDEKNKMLTRIYGYAFETQEELDKFMWQLEEAQKRDHRKLGPKLGIFMFSPLVGPGLPILLPKGTLVRRAIENYLIKIKEDNGHKFVWTPHIARSELYRISKHWQKYDAMMPPIQMEDDEYTLKPMNCPHHFQIYNESPKSYRDLPLRLAENATVYRNEKSGEINGLLRVRALTQDDSHWFVQHDLLEQEIDRAIAMMQEIYEDFGLTDYKAEISIRDLKKKDDYIGDVATWDNAEKILEASTKKRNIPYKVVEGECAFYGPKIDLRAEDSLKRTWQLMTIQLDFNQPINFDMTYTDADGTEKRPAVLHIAILGSIERFLAVIIEHYAGAFPMWLAPVQVTLLPIADRHIEYANTLIEQFKEAGMRVEIDSRSERLNAKIRDAEMQKVPYILIIGDKEAASECVSVRPRGRNDMGMMLVSNFINMAKKEIDSKGRQVVGNEDNSEKQEIKVVQKVVSN
jgi:threonyl-tRNA synthetase